MKPNDIYLFEDCNNSNNLFRYENIPGTLTEGYVYNINGGYGFNGYAKVIAYAEEGSIYSASGVVFVGGPTQCPTPTNTQTPTSSPTPTPTPTPSATEELSVEAMSYSSPSGCTYDTFCFGTTLSSLSGYSGNYTSGSTYNDSPVYSGDGTSGGFIYYYTGASESYWCLSDTIGGTCYLRGSSPCTSDCPDISGNLFATGLCPTPTATAANCSTFDFNAYFDCDYEPVPTPTPSVACEDVNFDVTTYGVTPTPTATSYTCLFTGVDFVMSGYTPAVSPTVTLTPTLTLTKTVDVKGQVSFTMLDEVFSCVSTKVLVDCESGNKYYTSDTLTYQGIPIVIGMIMFASVNGNNVCVTYERDDTNISSNSNVDNIFNLYSSCEYCSTLPTPTPTVTTTPSSTPALTLTPTSTPTSSPDAPGSTPRATTTQTPTITSTPKQTSTVTSTPTPTPNWVYVYESCSPLNNQIKNTQVIQRYNITTVLLNNIFRDSINNCWKYLGRFEQNYIAPPTVFTITNNGNYFVNANTTTIYNDCNSCQLPSAVCAPKEYNITSAGNFYWTDCNGIDRYNYFTTNDSPICICNSNNLPTSLDGGKGTLAGGGCSCTGPTLPPSVLTSYRVTEVEGADAGCYTGDFYINFTITLLDQYGNPITATSNKNFIITYNYDDVQDVGGGYFPDSTIDLAVTNGNSSATQRFYTKKYEYCNYSSLCDGTCYNTSTGMYVSYSPI